MCIKIQFMHIHLQSYDGVVRLSRILLFLKYVEESLDLTCALFHLVSESINQSDIRHMNGNRCPAEASSCDYMGLVNESIRYSVCY